MAVSGCLFVLVRAAAGADVGAVLMAGASRQQGDALLNLFYPDHDNFWLGYCRACRRCWRFSLAGDVSASRLWPRCAGCWCYRNAAVALAAAAMAERRIALGLTIGCWSRISMPLVAVSQPSPQSLFSEDQVNGTFCRSCTPTCVE
jgi:hypothetical protein